MLEGREFFDLTNHKPIFHALGMSLSSHRIFDTFLARTMWLLTPSHAHPSCPALLPFLVTKALSASQAVCSAHAHPSCPASSLLPFPHSSTPRIVRKPRWRGMSALRIHIDLFGRLPAACGYTHVFTVVDRSTHWLTNYFGSHLHHPPRRLDLQFWGPCRADL